ncbi:MAG: hypothetical protein JXB88_22065 [Spirochaetales bacterium]|nr:hypothetical protein [Spirochaetales bacterium]
MKKQHGKNNYDTKDNSLFFLSKSTLCDYENNIIINKANEISCDMDNEKEIAQKIFYYVRDKILFNATLNIFQKASTSINQKVIDYCNKVNIHLALLKAKDIPGRLHYVKVKKERLKGTIPTIMYKKIPDPIGHFYCECYINKKWIACEAIYDIDFYSGMINKGIIREKQLPTIDWNGENDLILLKELIVEDIGIYRNIDDLIENELKKYAYPPRWLCKLFDWTAKIGSSKRTNKIRKINK